MWHRRPGHTRVSASEDKIIGSADCNQRLCIDNRDACQWAGINYVKRLPGLSTIYAVPDPARAGIKAVDDRPSLVVVVQKGEIGRVGAGVALDRKLNDGAVPLLSAVDAVKDLTIIVR
jgi:hypothetical protein